MSSLGEMRRMVSSKSEFETFCQRILRRAQQGFHRTDGRFAAFRHFTEETVLSVSSADKKWFCQAIMRKP